jgi:hypothetical protein
VDEKNLEKLTKFKERCLVKLELKLDNTQA